MDFPLSSSVILVIAVALWLVWVAPYMLRNRRHHRHSADGYAHGPIDSETAIPQAGNVMKMAARQERSMTSTQRTEPGFGSIVSDGGPMTHRPVPEFRIRYGRLALALAGLLFVLTGVVSAALGIFGVGSFWLPLLSFLGAAAAVVSLRWFALRDRSRKVDAAFRAAMYAPVGPAMFAPAHPPLYEPAPAPRERVESPLFDAQAGAADRKPAPKALTALELRQAALAEAAASGEDPVGSVPRTAQGSSWEPVEVPKPTYVEAAKAERAAPEPLDLPEAPKAAGRPSLKQDHPHPRTETRAADAAAKPLGKAQSALSNLDDVLQRRRA